VKNGYKVKNLTSGGWPVRLQTSGRGPVKMLTGKGPRPGSVRPPTQNEANTSKGTPW